MLTGLGFIFSIWVVFGFMGWMFCPIMAASLAKHKNRDMIGWFFLGLVVGPLAFAVYLLPALPNDEQEKCIELTEPIEESPLDMKIGSDHQFYGWGKKHRD
jgi:hypothetical protein